MPNLSTPNFLEAGRRAPMRNGARDRRPHVVPIVADHLGYGDLSCQGSTALRTPSLDAIAAEGTRDHVVQHAGRLALRRRDWKVVPGGPGAALLRQTNTETGYQSTVPLYDLAADPGETSNLANVRPDIVARMRVRLARIRSGA